MKKNVLTAIVALLTTAALHAQVERIATDKGLEFEAPLSNTKAIMTSEDDKTLWVTDGTAAGTFQLSPAITHIDEGALLNGKYVFVGATPETGEELYITDGTVAGTTLLMDINTGAIGSSPDDEFALLNGFLYFTAERPAEGRELWRTDGTPGGTTLVKDIVPGPVGSNTPDRSDLFSNGTYLLFSVNTPATGEEVWVSNGTDAGTVPLAEINPGAASSNPSGFFKFGNLVLFTATDAQRGTEVWRTDGTAAGTQIVKDINPGLDSSVNSTNFVFFFPYEFNGRVYFMADDGTHGLELWSTDGIEANTRILKDIEPGAGTGLNFFLGGFRVGNKFLFTANNSATGIELWETDGTEAGTKLFKDIVPGPEGSTALVIPTATYNINTNTVSYPFFQGNKFFLVATTPQSGMELWISDGTEQGTTMVKDINPDEEDGVTLSSFVYTSTAFFFAATDGVHGEELWKSDGTANGTTMVANINTMPGEDGADADSEVALAPFIINNKVVFSATDDEQSPSDLYVVEGSFNALPVKLGDFIVTPKNADALLEWSTLSEVNTKDFTVQRSEDGIKFTPVGTVAAAGSSSTERRYQFIDKGIINSGKTIVYYKLAMNDKDGHSENTKVIPLKLKGTAELTVKLLGNPVQSQIVLMMSGNTNATVSLKDMSGKTFNTRTVRANGQISVPASNLAPGMYMIVVETDNSRKVVKFMKK